MADSPRGHGSGIAAPAAAAPPPPPPLPPPPPPAPPLPPQRYANRATSALARLAHPFIYGSRPPSPQPTSPLPVPTPPPALVTRPSYTISPPGSAPIITHKTGIPISAVDISPQRTHAIVAGREILKTIRVTSSQCTEETNVRSAVIGHGHHPSGTSSKNKEHLATKDVKWSHSEYNRIIATATSNGRIVIYDLSRPGVEYGRFHEHSRQVHRLAFSPYRGAWLLSGSQDATVRLWDLRTVSSDRASMHIGSTNIFNGHSEAVRDIRWSPAEPVEFATATDSGVIQRWDIRKDNVPIIRINAHEKACSSVDWHPDGKHLLSGSVDRQVKVWNFSSTDRRQKPCLQLRTPQAVLNARWRPPSLTGHDYETASWESTQIVTSYDQEDPRIHIWDFRRPHIPYKEIDRYSNSATDLLWHSQDYLWSVSSEGIFMQTDISLAPDAIERRSPCAVTWSPDGKVLAFFEPRHRRHKQSFNYSNTETVESIPVPIPRKGREGDDKLPTASHSLTDEAPEEASQMIGLRKRSNKITSTRSSKSLSATPPMQDDELQVVPLVKSVGNIKDITNHQDGMIGRVEGATFDPGAFHYLVHHYSPLLADPLNERNMSVEVVKYLLDGLDENTMQAAAVRFGRLAQTWRIVRYAISQELLNQHKQRQLELKQNSTSKAPPKIGSRGSSTNMLKLDPSIPDKAKNRIFKGVVDGDSQRLMTLSPEPNSGATTPLARPIPDSSIGAAIASGQASNTGLNEDLGQLRPIPSLILSSDEVLNKQVQASETALENETGWPQDSNGMKTPTNKHPTAHSSEEAIADQTRSAPRAISGRAEWRRDEKSRPKPTGDESAIKDDDGEGDEDGSKKGNEDIDAPQNYQVFRKRLLSMERAAQERPAIPVAYKRHDSGESFPMFSASDSSHRTKSFDEASFSLTNVHSRYESGGWPAATEGSLHNIPELEGSSPPRPGRWENHSDSMSDMSLEDLPTQSATIDLERPVSPFPFLAESSPIKKPSRVGYSRPPARLKSPAGSRNPSLPTESTVTLPLCPESASDAPWGVQTIVREIIKHYCSSSSVDILSASHLLHKMHILYSSCDELLPQGERELIFKAFNEQLLRQGMFVEAAEFRLVCVPSYPSLYDYAQKDTFINVFCFECNKPYENPIQDNKLCHRCDTAQPPCTICVSRNPPAEWAAKSNLSSLPDSNNPGDLSSTNISPLEDGLAHQQQEQPGSRLYGSGLWSWCQTCGHGAHTACLTAWLTDISLSEGGCPTPGCFHDCGPGPRREQNRLAQQEASKRARNAYYGRKPSSTFIKRDSWTAGESRAVERVRGMLGGGLPNAGEAGLAAGQGNPSGSGVGAGSGSSAIISPKKVRLVAPGEQDSEGHER
ncbi:SEA (Seh1-associated) complex subunit [Microsporum ferrugineum]